MADRWESALADARLAWPGVDLDRAEIRQAIDRVRGRDGSELAATHLVDVVLAMACATNDATAIAYFDRLWIEKIPAMLSKVERDPMVLDEVKQRVRVRVLIGGGDDGSESPRIAEYAGRGSLASWVKVVALRVHANLRRAGARALETGEQNIDRAEATHAALDRSPEVALAKQRYGDAFSHALRAALGDLDPKERTLLKLVYVDGVALDRLGVTYGVHKSTVSRWVSAAKEKVLAETFRRASVALSLDNPKEIESLLLLVRSELDLSLGGVFTDL